MSWMMVGKAIAGLLLWTAGLAFGLVAYDPRAPLTARGRRRAVWIIFAATVILLAILISGCQAEPSSPCPPGRTLDAQIGDRTLPATYRQRLWQTRAKCRGLIMLESRDHEYDSERSTGGTVAAR
jgi:hypothetical protein